MNSFSTHPARAAVAVLVGLAVIGVLLYVWWPAGVLVGGTAGVIAVAQIGLAMQRAANAAQPTMDVETAIAMLAEGRQDSAAA